MSNIKTRDTMDRKQFDATYTYKGKIRFPFKIVITYCEKMTRREKMATENIVRAGIMILMPLIATGKGNPCDECSNGKNLLCSSEEKGVHTHECYGCGRIKKINESNTIKQKTAAKRRK